MIIVSALSLRDQDRDREKEKERAREKSLTIVSRHQDIRNHMGTK